MATFLVDWARWVAAGTAGACVAALLAAAPAKADDGTPSVQPDVGTHTVITGVVTSDGQALGGAEILLLAWPNQDQLEALGDGDPVSTEVVGRATADPEGQFAISFAPAAVKPEHTGVDGQMDLELVVAHADHEVMWSFTVTRSAPGEDRNGSAWANPRVSELAPAERLIVGLAPTHVLVDLGSDPTIVELGDEPSTWVDEEGQVVSPTAAAESASVALHPRRTSAGMEDGDFGIMELWCATNTYRNNLSEQFVRAVGTIQGKPWVVQTTSSSHSLGVGIQSSSGKWSTSGTRTISTKASADNHMGFNVSVYNRVNYRKYAGCGTTTDQWRPHSFNSLNDRRVLHTSRPSWNHCSSFIYKNGTNSKTQGSNATYSAGVDFPNIKLSSKASFSSSTKIRWAFSGSGARLCGSSSLGWARAPQAGAYVP